MSFKQKPNNGALFKNTRKESDKGPDYRGDLNVEGTDYWIAAWLKESKDGKKYMSLAVTPKEGTVTAKQKDDDSDVPF